MELLFLYFEGHSRSFVIMITLCYEISENSADRDEMQHYATFYLGLYCLTKYLFEANFRMKRFN